MAGFLERDRFDEQQRVTAIIQRRVPALHRAGAGVIGGDDLGEEALGQPHVAQVFEIGLADFDVEGRIGQITQHFGRSGHLRGAVDFGLHLPRCAGHQLHQALGAGP